MKYHPDCFFSPFEITISLKAFQMLAGFGNSSMKFLRKLPVPIDQMPRDTYKYTNGEVTIVWKPNVCIHSGICIRGLPLVFDNQRRPWIDPNAADTQTMIAQVKKCPSGALSYFMNEDNAEGADDITTLKSDEAAYPAARQNAILNVEITPNGPICIHQECQIRYSDGREELKKGKIFLCRCGGSGNKPYCDGTHRKNGFQG